MIGHPQGASGAAGVVATALALAEPAAAADDQPARSGSGLRSRLHPERRARTREVDAALCNCLGFGSKNSALVLGRTVRDECFSDKRFSTRLFRLIEFHVDVNCCMLDVIIAGAGPPDRSPRLSRRGPARACSIVDRETFPRDKLCGDTLNPGAVALLRRSDLAGGPLAAARPLPACA